MNKLLTFDQLKAFISHRMKLNHFCYQPVMLRVLLNGGGCADVVDIATELLINCDQNTIKNYVRLINKHPGHILGPRRHKIVEPIKKGGKITGYRLMTDFASLTGEQIDDLMELCFKRQEEKSPVYISGPNRIATNSASKNVRRCDFCGIEPHRVESESDYCLAVRDKYPVSELHTLVIPKRHVASYFELDPPEVNAIHGMLEEQRDKLRRQDQSISGFNLGINDGENAGQTIMHAHVHLIPRRKGDVDEPRGGVRGVIPEHRIY